MRTPVRHHRIPAGRAVIAVTFVLSALLAACGGDDDQSDATDVSIGLPATVVATDAPDDTEADRTTVARTTVPLPPDDTTDIPLPPGTGDIPVFTPPETSDVPVYLSVTVGSDDSPTRIENVPFGASVTMDVVNLEGSDEFHLQGYELGAGEVMGPGQTYTFVFVANQLGDFVLESLATGDVLLTLHVG
jgi:hypothetical protein